MTTNQQLKDAFCRAKSFEGTTEEKNTFLTEQKARYNKIAESNTESAQVLIDSLSKTGVQLMKSEALAQISKEEADQLIIDSSGVTL